MALSCIVRKFKNELTTLLKVMNTSKFTQQHFSNCCREWKRKR